MQKAQIPTFNFPPFPAHLPLPPLAHKVHPSTKWLQIQTNQKPFGQWSLLKNKFKNLKFLPPVSSFSPNFLIDAKFKINLVPSFFGPYCCDSKKVLHNPQTSKPLEEIDLAETSTFYLGSRPNPKGQGVQITFHKIIGRT